ncbi:MAG TPA: exo-beta-N-acetylmuramidase NamZ domain-containing protein [Thermoanaerobaculia bacterium]|nr:exo-beta-N-acetylmuramidase NamZ domain-containing protein [Thermoanaerobaculia bacterium]
MRPFARLLFPFFLLVLAAAGCVTLPGAASLDPALLEEVDEAVAGAIAENRIIGGVFFIDSSGQRFGRTWGLQAVEPSREPVAYDTIYDLASLTKVVATTPSIMLLIERGLVGIDAPVRTYIPEMREGDITVRHLLTHTSGLRPSLSLNDPWNGYEEGIERAARERAINQPGFIFRYSDINFILLGEIVRRVSGRPLHAFSREEIFRPLGMVDTSFRPDPRLRHRMAPTETVEPEGVLRGVVHDPTSRRMGGVAGHAGLFSTVDDLRRYAGMILGRGSLDGVRIMKPETVDLMTHVGTPEGVSVRRSPGWDMESTYSRPRGSFPFGSFGHTGWTGPFLWIDPASETFYLFLTNRNHPSGGSVLALQERLGELASRLAGYEPAAPDSRRIGVSRGGSAQNGIDVLTSSEFAPLRGMKIGLITNHTGRDRYGNPTIDVLRSAPGVELARLFSPEHGIRGALDGKIEDGIDDASGLPIYSLYGERRAPSASQLEELDALVFDVQDIGARFYTYISTMKLAMEAAGRAGVKFVVLDRVNPITGLGVEGPSDVAKESFTAIHPISVRHGMTVGELAVMFNDESPAAADLTVIPIRGWKREEWFDSTGLPWFPTSPNMRTLEAAILYPGVCLVEQTNVSVGRGTATPFEWIGAPWIDGEALAAELSRYGVKGVRFMPERRTPSSSKHSGESCGGVRLEITDRKELASLELGAAIIVSLWRLEPETFRIDGVTTLLQHPATVEAVRKGADVGQVLALWSPSLESFIDRRAMFLKY